MRLLGTKRSFLAAQRYAKNIVSLGTAGLYHAADKQPCHHLLPTMCSAVTGGDIYISVMTIVSSVRQLVETPIYAITEGSSPIISYNYGARRPARVQTGLVSRWPLWL